MAIKFHCEACGKKLGVADHLAGKRARCPGCSAVLTIPTGSLAPSPPRPRPPVEQKTEYDIQVDPQVADSTPPGLAEQPARKVARTVESSRARDKDATEKGNVETAEAVTPSSVGTPSSPNPPASASTSTYIAPAYSTNSAGIALVAGESLLYFWETNESGQSKAISQATTGLLTLGLLPVPVEEVFFFATDRRLGALTVSRNVGLWGNKPSSFSCASFDLAEIYVAEIVFRPDYLTLEYVLRREGVARLQTVFLPPGHRDALQSVLDHLRRLKGGWEEPPEIMTTSQKLGVEQRQNAEKVEFLARMSPKQRQLYAKLEAMAPTRPREDLRLLVERTEWWTTNRESLRSELATLAERREPLTIGILDPLIERMIETNLDPGEHKVVTMRGSGADTLCATDKRVIIVLALKDLEASSSGTGGAIAGGVAGHEIGKAIGGAIGASHGFTGLLVGEAIGEAAGMVLGAKLGKDATSRDVEKIVPVFLPYEVIYAITAGFKSVTTGGESLNQPTISFAPKMSRRLIEFVYESEDTEFGNAVVRALKIVLQDAQARRPAEVPPPTPSTSPQPLAVIPEKKGSKEDIIGILRQLGELKAAGILTDEEFQAKKKELLSRL